MRHAVNNLPVTCEDDMLSTTINSDAKKTIVKVNDYFVSITVTCLFSPIISAINNYYMIIS